MLTLHLNLWEGCANGIEYSPISLSLHPSSSQPCPFEGKPHYPSPQGGTKPSSPETQVASTTPPHEVPVDLEQPGTPVPADDPEAMDTGSEKPSALAEPRGEEEGQLTKKGKKKKSVRWAEEEQLTQYFYFDLDETERGERTKTNGNFNSFVLVGVVCNCTSNCGCIVKLGSCQYSS